MDIKKYCETLKYLKKSQIRYLIKNRLTRRKAAVTDAKAPVKGELALWMPRPVSYTHLAKGSRLIMITAHRRENLGEPMKHMFRAIRRVCDEHPDIKAIYPCLLYTSHAEESVRCIAGNL